MRDILNDLEAGKLLSDPDPVKRAQIQMRTTLPKRFYTTVTVEPAGEGGFEIHLDGKPVRTPAQGADHALPTRSRSADSSPTEFAAQADVINPVTMPAMRLVNTAIDGVAKETDAVAEDILRFASSDLLCYRADAPEGLVARQNEAWDPLSIGRASALGARFVLAEGIVHVAAAPCGDHCATDPSRPAAGAVAAGRSASDDVADRLRAAGAGCRRRII